MHLFKKMNCNIKHILAVGCSIVMVACTNYTPKPMGYFRIALMEKEYAYTQANMPIRLNILPMLHARSHKITHCG